MPCFTSRLHCNQNFSLILKPETAQWLNLACYCEWVFALFSCVLIRHFTCIKYILSGTWAAVRKSVLLHQRGATVENLESKVFSDSALNSALHCEQLSSAFYPQASFLWNISDNPAHFTSGLKQMIKVLKITYKIMEVALLVILWSEFF